MKKTMTRGEATKIIKEKIKELKPCPFCGVIPIIEYEVDEKYSSHGSLGHKAKRLPCCEVMGMGQLELFFANNWEKANFELWKWATCRLVDNWNKRKEIV